MAISKLILNGEVQMDVTSDTVTSATMVSGTTATKNDGTKVTGSIASKSSSDLTVSGATVSVPAGYYSTAATKNVAAGSAFPPAVTITKAPTFSMNSATGVITASYTGSSSITPTVTSGYITAGTAGIISTTGTSTYQLASAAATTYYPSIADQTISSYRWLKGTQTIKSVTTSNITAENIKKGVVVKVGDANNASRITQITGTYDNSPKFTATLLNNGTFDDRAPEFNFVKYDNVSYYTQGNTFEFGAGNGMYCYLTPYAQTTLTIYENGIVKSQSNATYLNYYYTLPGANINIQFSGTTDMYITTEASFAEDGIIQRTISGEYTNNRVYSIGNSAFQMCTALTSVSFPVATTIGSNAFYNCTNLVSISIPNATQLGSGAFQRCFSLTSVNFPEVTDIGSYAFANCSNLASVSFPKVTTIYSSAFYFCSALTSVDFPVATSVSPAMFYSCAALTSVSFPVATSIGTMAFYNCFSLKSVSFPAVTFIGGSAFNGCSALTSVNFPEVSSIGFNAFQYCRSLAEVNFPSVVSIGANAFRSCTSLNTASFARASTIGSSAFMGCTSLMALYILSPTVATLSLSIFVSTPMSNSAYTGSFGSIYVPASLVDSYKTATNWSVYSDRITSYIE